MDCDIRFYYNSFIAFKTEWKSWDKTYQLILYTEDHEIPLIIDSQIPSYTPVLIEHRGTAYVAYIDESFSIHVLNIDTREMVNEIPFETPLFDLKKDIFTENIMKKVKK